MIKFVKNYIDLKKNQAQIMPKNSKKRKISMEPILQDYTVSSVSDINLDVPGPSDSSIYQDMKDYDVNISDIVLNSKTDFIISSGPYPSDSSLTDFSRMKSSFQKLPRRENKSKLRPSVVNSNSKGNNSHNQIHQPFQNKSRNKKPKCGHFDSLVDSGSETPDENIDIVHKPFQRKRKITARPSLYDLDLNVSESYTSNTTCAFKKPFQRKLNKKQKPEIFDSILKDSEQETPDGQYNNFKNDSKKKMGSDFLFLDSFNNDSLNTSHSVKNDFITRTKTRKKKGKSSSIFDEDLHSSQSDVSLLPRPLIFKYKSSNIKKKVNVNFFDDALNNTLNMSENNESSSSLPLCHVENRQRDADKNVFDHDLHTNSTSDFLCSEIHADSQQSIHVYTENGEKFEALNGKKTNNVGCEENVTMETKDMGKGFQRELVALENNSNHDFCGQRPSLVNELGYEDKKSRKKLVVTEYAQTGYNKDNLNDYEEDEDTEKKDLYYGTEELTLKNKEDQTITSKEAVQNDENNVEHSSMNSEIEREPITENLDDQSIENYDDQSIKNEKKGQSSQSKYKQIDQSIQNSIVDKTTKYEGIKHKNIENKVKKLSTENEEGRPSSQSEEEKYLIENEKDNTSVNVENTLVNEEEVHNKESFAYGENDSESNLTNPFYLMPSNEKDRANEMAYKNKLEKENEASNVCCVEGLNGNIQGSKKSLVEALRSSVCINEDINVNNLSLYSNEDEIEKRYLNPSQINSKEINSFIPDMSIQGKPSSTPNAKRKRVSFIFDHNILNPAKISLETRENHIENKLTGDKSQVDKINTSNQPTQTYDTPENYKGEKLNQKMTNGKDSSTVKILNDGVSVDRKSSLHNNNARIYSNSKLTIENRKERRVSFKLCDHVNSPRKSSAPVTDIVKHLKSRTTSINKSSFSLDSLVYDGNSENTTPNSESIFIDIHPSRSKSTSDNNDSGSVVNQLLVQGKLNMCSTETEKDEYVEEESQDTLSEDQDYSSLDQEGEQSAENEDEQGTENEDEEQSGVNDNDEQSSENEEEGLSKVSEEGICNHNEEYIARENNSTEHVDCKELDMGKINKSVSLMNRTNFITTDDNDDVSSNCSLLEPEKKQYNSNAHQIKILEHYNPILPVSTMTVGGQVRFTFDVSKHKEQAKNLFKQPLPALCNRKELQAMLDKLQLSELKKKKRKSIIHCISKEQLQQYKIEEGLKKNHQHKSLFTKRSSNKLIRPKKWVSPKLYKLIISKLQPQFGLKSHIRAEEVVLFLVDHVERVLKKKEFHELEDDVVEMWTELAHLGIIKTYWDFYEFVMQNFDSDFKYKIFSLSSDQTAFDFAPEDLFENIL